MISTKQYTDTYNLWKKSLLDSAEKIAKSSECRKFLLKNSETAPYDVLLRAAVECIYDLTGDECFRKGVTERLERRMESDNRRSDRDLGAS